MTVASPSSVFPLTIHVLHRLNETALPALTAVRRAGRTLSIHAIDAPGAFRRGPVMIRHSPHTPPPADTVEEGISALFIRLREAWMQQDTAWLAGLVLWRVSWIHPYREANGRTARAASRCIASAHGRCPVACVFEQGLVANRPSYYDALHSADAAFIAAGTLDAGAAAMRDFMRPHIEAASCGGASPIGL